jgi:hypothetical protein
VAWRARTLFLLLALDVEGDLAALEARGAAERERAAERLRRDLSASDLGLVLASLRSDGLRRRAALVEILVDRRDLALALWTDERSLPEPLLADLARGAFVKAWPHAEEPVPELWLSAIAGSPEIACRGERLTVDDLAYEARRAHVLPSPLLVDPGAQTSFVALPRGVVDAGSGILESLARAGITVLPCGAERFGDRIQPSFILMDGEAHGRIGDRGIAWMRAWRSATGISAVRAATALLALSIDPLDAAVVASIRGESASSAVAYAAVLAVPERGAALLGADPSALDGFLARAGSGPEEIPPRALRVLEMLPSVDASGREVDRRLLDACAAAEGCRKAGLLSVLASRRVLAARDEAVAAIQSSDPRARAAGMRVLHLCDDPAAVPAALHALSASDHRVELRTAARVLISRAGAPERTASALAEARGIRRAVILGVLLHAADESVLRRAVQAIDAVADPRDLEAIAETGEEGRWDRDPRKLMAAFAPSIANGNVSALVVASLLRVVPPERREASLARLLEPFPEAWEEIALRAAGALGLAPAVVGHLRDQLLSANSPVGARLAAARGIREHLRGLPRAARALLRDELFMAGPGRFPAAGSSESRPGELASASAPGQHASRDAELEDAVVELLRNSFAVQGFPLGVSDPP